jgi:1,4-alpha-glucan branching enzyme
LAPLPVQFMLDRPGAREVRLIGDFNGWGADTIRLVRDPGGVWSAIVPLVPGRHTYAFVVDDSVVLDPRSRSAVDPDFNVERSVVIVGR